MKAETAKVETAKADEGGGRGGGEVVEAAKAEAVRRREAATAGEAAAEAVEKAADGVEGALREREECCLDGRELLLWRQRFGKAVVTQLADFFVRKGPYVFSDASPPRARF